ncbi:carbohydrate esterase family 5 protein [Baudoinia panamericana UAMH 10762]|uniref:Carbohydrate esterase family 5 protein n=1 Tax=Baudoinia panamericana (strain UAMH 10762) TaxID=717646 RepID=M2MSS1_BAUPA|nr:carbohydrate esterase family 5 protein [Baudoinia panamericana UAMH 10762]EMC94548.1 carbohydrate esterase family 5 protein [Baudoinia panamericana UAMH 10762]
MHFLSFSVSLALSLCCAGVARAQDPCSYCDDVHFFLARGNNEPYPGRQAALVQATCDGIKNCGYENLYFSALYTDLYCQTAYDGAVAGHVQMTAYAERCPNSKLILAGYSQGGQIASDILGGGGGYSFNGCYQPQTPPLNRSTSPGNKIAAVIIFGDTRHTANQPYNYGNGSNLQGYFPRPDYQVQNLLSYAPIMRNWCVSTDPICAANQTWFSETSHLSYYNTDSQAAASWIQSVASLSLNDPSFTTSIFTSYSGTVQNYATVGTATPSGTVTTDATWTQMTTYSACTATSYSRSSSSINSTSFYLATSAAAINSANATASQSIFPITSSTGVAKIAATTSASIATASATAQSAGVTLSMGAQGIVMAFVVLALALY